MTTHDVLAYAVAQQIMHDMRAAAPDWSPTFSANVTAGGTGGWPRPDFVIQDSISGEAMAAEFKPPDQTKREYLTGLGQALSYTRDFHYSLLVVPAVADDGYVIADHIHDVVAQDVADPLPLALVRYDASTLTPGHAQLEILRALRPRTGVFTGRPAVESSFYAKWRDASPDELGRLLEYLYEEGRRPHQSRSVRDRAFDRLWVDMTTGGVMHLQHGPRSLTDTSHNKRAWGKNYRNFVTHIGWCGPDGKLTGEGLDALRVLHVHGAWSRVFIDQIARAVLGAGKHLVLLNAINELQNAAAPPSDEATWLNSIETGLEAEGLVKRNPGRHAAAVQGSSRAFLKSEKTLWRHLNLIRPRGERVFHPYRGLIIDWGRITSLISS